MSNEQKQPGGISEPGIYVGYLPAMGWAMLFGIFTLGMYSSWAWVMELCTSAAAVSLLIVAIECCRMVVHGQTTAAAMTTLFGGKAPGDRTIPESALDKPLRDFVAPESQATVRQLADSIGRTEGK